MPTTQELDEAAKPTAGFTAKSQAEIARFLSETDTGQEEVLPLIRECLSQMDAFELKHAGSPLAAELPGIVAATRKAQQSLWKLALVEFEILIASSHRTES